MKYNLLDGKKLSEEILLDISKKIKEEKIKAKLVAILIGHDSASEIYVKKKSKKCKETGIDFELIRFEGNTSEEVEAKILELNTNPEVTGILLQLPLPEKFDADKMINLIIPNKDVDGLTNTNRRKVKQGDETFACCTAKGIIRLLEKNDISLEEKNVVLVGYGYLVGQPLSLMLKNRNLDFTVCDINTENLKEKTRKADILVSATGVAHLIKEDFVKDSAIVVDVSVSRLNNKIVGDVDFEHVKNKVSWITPIPGGIGPMTIAILMENMINAYELQNKD